MLQDTPKPSEIFHLFRAALLPLSGQGALGAVKVKANLWWRSLTKRLHRDITIHIRSGDIFSKDNPHPEYWQPPLDYYTTVTTEERPGQVTLVFEDTANPVIPALIEWLRNTGIRYKLEDGPIEAAIAELATSHHVVGGLQRGSFLRPILAMSRSARKITSFGEPNNEHKPRVEHMNPAKSGRRRVRVVAAEGYQALVSPWTNSPEQRNNMLCYKLTPAQQAALRPA